MPLVGIVLSFLSITELVTAPRRRCCRITLVDRNDARALMWEGLPTAEITTKTLQSFPHLTSLADHIFFAASTVALALFITII